MDTVGGQFLLLPNICQYGREDRLTAANRIYAGSNPAVGSTHAMLDKSRPVNSPAKFFTGLYLKAAGIRVKSGYNHGQVAGKPDKFLFGVTVNTADFGSAVCGSNP